MRPVEGGEVGQMCCGKWGHNKAVMEAMERRRQNKFHVRSKLCLLPCLAALISNSTLTNSLSKKF